MREVLGFLSRWCLLAMAALAVGLSGWATMRSASTAAAGVPQCVLSDAIWQSGQRAGVNGYFTPLKGIRGKHQFLSRRPGGRITYAQAGANKIHIPIANADVGLLEVLVKGVAYGTFAFYESRAICRVIPAGREVYAFDVRLVFDGEGGPDKLPAEILRATQERGEVVFFNAGRIEEYAALREDLRARYPTTPHVFATGREHHRMHTLYHIASTLRRRRGDKPHVITADRNLAYAAAAARFSAHWIGPKRPGELDLANPARYDSWSAFAAWLARPTPAK